MNKSWSLERQSPLSDSNQKETLKLNRDDALGHCSRFGVLLLPVLVLMSLRDCTPAEQWKQDPIPYCIVHETSSFPASINNHYFSPLLIQYLLLALPNTQLPPKIAKGPCCLPAQTGSFPPIRAPTRRTDRY